MKSGTVPRRQLTRFVQTGLARLRRTLMHVYSKISVSKDTDVSSTFVADYEARRDRFLHNRLRLALWVALGFNSSVIILLLAWIAIGIGKKFPQLGEQLLSIILQELLLLVCFALHKSEWGKRHPAIVFLCLSWTMTLFRQAWATLHGYALPVLKSWSLVFLTQAALMPVRWSLHLLSQVVLLAYYWGVNGWLGLEPPFPQWLDPKVKQLLFGPSELAVNVLYLFWFCLVCNISVYLYERLQRAELRSRLKLEAAEVKYRSIFDNAAEGIFQSTPDGRYITANPALAKIYGFCSPEEVLAHFTDLERQLYVEPDRRAEFVRLMEENNEVSNFESQIYRADGSIVWICEQAKTVRDANGKTLYYEGLIEDITERKQAEEALRVFFHAVSHDLRNPVLGTLLVLKNLQNQPGETITISRSILERTIQSSDRQIKLIDSLLEAHASEVRGIICKCEPLQLAELIQAVIADIEPMMVQYQATLTNLVSADLPLVSADPNQLWRVLENLIGNALKHNPPGVAVTVNATVEAGMVRCTVEDNGIGISQQQGVSEAAPQEHRLFQLYVRGSQSRHTPGLGIGLYLCQQIVAAHGGEIDVISSPGVGTKFWFTLHLVDNS